MSPVEFIYLKNGREALIPSGNPT